MSVCIEISSKRYFVIFPRKILSPEGFYESGFDTFMKFNNLTYSATINQKIISLENILSGNKDINLRDIFS